MNKYDEQACCFMQLLCRFLADENNYMLHVNDYEEVRSDKVLLGYYDDEYLYFIPNIITGMCDTFLMQNKLECFDMREVMFRLYMRDYIKYRFEVSGKFVFRPQKCIGNTRKNYITFKLEVFKNNFNEEKIGLANINPTEEFLKYVCKDLENASVSVRNSVFYSLLFGKKIEIDGLGTFDINVDSNGKVVPVFEVDEVFRDIFNVAYSGKE